MLNTQDSLQQTGQPSRRWQISYCTANKNKNTLRMEYLRRETKLNGLIDCSCSLITPSHFTLYRNALHNVDGFEEHA